MREDVKKFLFVGAKEIQESFFKEAQQKGIIHFIDPKLSSKREIPLVIKNFHQALKILRGLPLSDQEENYMLLNAEDMVKTIINLYERLENLSEKQKVIEADIARIQVFGDFSFDDIDYIERQGKRTVQFFCVRSDIFEKEPTPDNLFFVASEHGLDYYISIGEEPLINDKMIEMKFSKSLHDLRYDLKQNLQDHARLDHELKTYAKYNDYLHHMFHEKLNEVNLHNVQSYVENALEGTLFVIEGWVPENLVGQLNDIVHEKPLIFEETAIEPEDVVPTYLENTGIPLLGEDLVNIYDTPSAKDKDPSGWVIAAFTLFFAFIINDAGYGLIFLAVALFLRFKFTNMKDTGKRFVKLLTILSLGCIVWGTLMTSFFGVELSINNPLRKLSLIDWLAEKKVAYYLIHEDPVAKQWVQENPKLATVTDPHEFIHYNQGHDNYVILSQMTNTVMFELALFIGVIHLITSCFRYVARKWYNIGWVLFLVGAYLYLPWHLNTPSILNYVCGIDLVHGGERGFELMMIGIVLAWFLLVAKYGFKGVFEITMLIQVFSDTLSYLRLYALGLAGAMVASTINSLIADMPFFIALVVALIGHSINILLAIMLGVIHGLRLNFLEWYRYSFEGGGKQFQPLKLLE